MATKFTKNKSKFHRFQFCTRCGESHSHVWQWRQNLTTSYVNRFHAKMQATEADGQRHQGNIGQPGPKFTNDLSTILRQFSDLRQSYDNWWIHRTFAATLRPILRQHLTITF